MTTHSRVLVRSCTKYELPLTFEEGETLHAKQHCAG